MMSIAEWHTKPGRKNGAGWVGEILVSVSATYNSRVAAETIE